MNIVKVVLLLTSIAITVGPIGTALVMYRDNLIELVVPSEASDILTTFSSEKPSATFENYEYNISLNTVTLKINLTNPYKFTLVVDSLSADVECREHHFHLGKAYSQNSQNIPSGSTKSVTLTVTWDEEALYHINNNHHGQSTVFVDLVQLKADVQGVNVQLQDRISIPDPIPIG